ncbi:MAG TPA: ABC transporter ATP-binding protein [Thermotogota bacterium]|nr:ABC transporter ATP-binding protein [Thermotogota bacterium]HPJ87519.1 ABC transporter ATP-binding protein [Thermotogota bacterium]HPR94724.1 ABC transporter ATP-binding protein [Thermotogota bacterium]
MSAEYMLELEDITISYGPIEAVKKINIKVPKGDIVTLIGANGAGKTSTLSTISGLVKTRNGKIKFMNSEITNKAPHLITQMGIVHVPEGRRIFSGLTVRENLIMGAYNRKDKAGIKKDLDWVFELFPRLKERINQPGGTLSGGEQQMLAISRGLMTNPKLMMLDEPSLGLAPLLVKEVFQVIRKINEEDGVTILLVEQNAASALNISDNAYVLETGEIKLKGDAKSLLTNPDVQKAYLGM